MNLLRVFCLVLLAGMGLLSLRLVQVHSLPQSWHATERPLHCGLSLSAPVAQGPSMPGAIPLWPSPVEETVEEVEDGLDGPSGWESLLGRDAAAVPDPQAGRHALPCVDAQDEGMPLWLSQHRMQV